MKVDCTCAAKTFFNGQITEIKLCPMHKAAPDLLAVLQKAVTATVLYWENQDMSADHAGPWLRDAQAIIQDLTGDR